MCVSPRKAWLVVPVVLALFVILSECQFNLLRPSRLDGWTATRATTPAAKLMVTGAFARATALKMDGMTMPATMPGDGVSSVYMVIQNNGDQPDRLVALSSDAAAAVELHETVIHDDMAHMNALTGLEIPAHGSVEMKPGGYHVMLKDLKRPLTPGDTITLTLTFQSGTELKVSVPVTAP